MADDESKDFEGDIDPNALLEAQIFQFNIKQAIIGNNPDEFSN